MAQGETATWTCACKSVTVRVPVAGPRLVCYCASCRGFVQQCDAKERLDAEGGSDLVQVNPADVEFITGAGHVRFTKMSKRGPMRWYTACCHTPMANTLGTRALAFASFQAHDLAPKNALPAISARVHLSGALGTVKEKKGSIFPLIRSVILRTISSWVTGRWRKHAFVKANGTPIAPRADLTPPSG